MSGYMMRAIKYVASSLNTKVAHKFADVGSRWKVNMNC